MTSIAAADQVAIHCSRCGREQKTRPTVAGEARLPRGWHRHPEPWCVQCWSAAFKLRAVTLPVAAPVDETWEELRAALKSAWTNSTTLANWAVRRLLQADAVRMPDLEKLPPMPRVYLYPDARLVVPEMDSSSVVAQLQAVERRYRAARYDVIWRQRAAPPTYRYPAPYPVHNKAWRVAWEAHEGKSGEQPTVSARLGGERRRLILRHGQKYARHIRSIRLIAEGKAVQGELSVFERGSEIMVKMVAWLPRTQSVRERSGTLRVSTTGESLLIYWMDGEDDIRRYHADHMRRRVRGYDRQRQRLYEDGAPEVDRDATRTRMGTLATKQRARLDAVTHEASAVITGYAARRGAALVVYDDTRKDYAEHFPWHQLRERLAWKLEERGITLEVSSGAAAVDLPQPLE